MSVSVPEILKQHTETLTKYFDDVLASLPDAPPRLVEAIRYSLHAGGKRLRPTLVLETYQAVSNVDCRMSNVDAIESSDIQHSTFGSSSVLAAAAAMELIHTFSLVHDDLPAMDDDDFRRGKPTNHKVFGEAMAILAGDAMMTLAFELLATRAQADLVPTLVRELAHASGPGGMVGGQVLDIDGENQSLALVQLQRIHRLKTGALLTTSCRLGAICARATADQLDAVTRFGQHMGLAFQIVDDILDETSTPQQLGKATQKDRGKGKNTYPQLLGLEESKAEAARQLQLATDALSPLGARADRLLLLARFIVDRTT